MKISTRGRYALRIVLDIALNQGEDGVVSMNDIAARQRISKKYGDQIAMQLCQSGILSATRGCQGGYRLSESPSDVNVYQVVSVVEGTLAPVECLECDTKSCTCEGYCITLPVWQGLDRVTNEYLMGVTLSDILREAQNGSAECVRSDQN
ncbi:MAG: Rrf2 family transcriptional regulator [Clostridia bacterium]|nr:Rrf2 family transcriptional regulator [Clostridia bacterium]